MLSWIFEEFCNKLIFLMVPEKNKNRGIIAAVTIANFCGVIGLLAYGIVMLDIDQVPGWIAIFFAAYMAIAHIGIVIYRICKVAGKRKKQLKENGPT